MEQIKQMQKTTSQTTPTFAVKPGRSLEFPHSFIYVHLRLKQEPFIMTQSTQISDTEGTEARKFPASLTPTTFLIK
jgi:hypothetical protein